jgi:hypothetical protein
MMQQLPKWLSYDLSGHVNMQNIHIYGATQSLCHLMYVWKCTDHRPDKLYFQQTVNSGQYVSNTFNPFFNYPIAQERQKGHVCVKAHHANKSMDVTCEVYGNRIINEGLWAPRAPDL